MWEHRSIRTLAAGLILCLNSTAAGFLFQAPGPTSFGAVDSISWTQLPGFWNPCPVSVVSANGLGTQVTCGNGIDQFFAGPGFTTFPEGEAIVLSDSYISLTFASPVFGAGANVFRDHNGSFTARIEAFNGPASLGAFTVDGTTDGSPPFLGVLDTEREITSVTFTMTGGWSAFFIDEVTLDNSPEPGSILLVAAAVLGWGCLRKYRGRLRRDPGGAGSGDIESRRKGVRLP